MRGELEICAEKLANIKQREPRFVGGLDVTPDVLGLSPRRTWTDLLFGDGQYWLVVALAGVLCASIFAANWHIDEGVISLFTDYFQKTGDLRYLFQHHNARFSFSWPYFYLLALVRGNALDPDTYFLLRVPSLVLCLLSLVAVHESLRALVHHRAVRALALVFFVAFCLHLGLTGARYDSPYLFGANIALLTAARLHQGRSWLWTCPGMLAAAFAGTTHPVGFGAIGFLGIVMAYYFVVRRPSRREAAIVATVAAASAALLIAGLLIDRTPSEFLADLKGVQDQYHTFTSNTAFEERQRYLSLLASGGLLPKAFIACLALGLVWPATREHRSAIRCCRVGLAALVAFLALIPTKWIFYLALLLPCATVLGAYHLSSVWRYRFFPWRRQWTCADDWLALRGIRLSQVLACAAAAYLALGVGEKMWVAAHHNTLLARLVRPNGKQASESRRLAQFLAGKSINLYSDLTIIPLLGAADYSRHCRWQPDYGVGEEIDLGDSGEYLVCSDGFRFITYDFIARHSQFSRYPPEKLTTACFFNDTFTVYRIPQDARGQEPQRHDQAQARVDPDARLQ